MSKQLRQLERAVNQKLFHRAGRNLVLTEAGHVVFRYAEEIFSLGQELTDVLQGKPVGSPLRLLVGFPHVLSKLVAYRLLEPRSAPARTGSDRMRRESAGLPVDGTCGPSAGHRALRIRRWVRTSMCAHIATCWGNARYPFSGRRSAAAPPSGLPAVTGRREDFTADSTNDTPTVPRAVVR